MLAVGLFGGFEVGDFRLEHADRINVGSTDFQNGFLKISLVKVEKNPAHEILFLDAALAKSLVENGEHGFEGVVGGKGNTDFDVRFWAPPGFRKGENLVEKVGENDSQDWALLTGA